jgi:hypothetical protein
MPSVEAMIALRKREMVQNVIKVTKVTLEEAVSYLQLGEWDSANAIDMASRDHDWAQSTKFERRPRTLADFKKNLATQSRHRTACATCAADVGEGRVHCCGCGRICCLSCHR